MPLSDDELLEQIDLAIDANPDGIVREKDGDKEVERISLTQLLKARGIVAARKARRESGMFAKARFRRT